MKQSNWSEPERFTYKNYILSNLNLSVEKVYENGHPQLHWHEYCEIEVNVKGKMIHHINGISRVIGAGCLYFLSPADFHEVEVIEPLEMYNISFGESLIPSEYLSYFIEINHGVEIIPSEKDFEYLKVIIERLYEEFHSEHRLKATYIQNLMNCIFTEIVYNSSTNEGAISEDMPEPIRRALMYLHCNFKDNPSLHTVAAASGFSDNYFCELFHKYTGKKFNRYLNNLKLQYAYNLIFSSNASITDICFSSGFDSMSHFQHEFKAKYKCSSSELRKSVKLNKVSLKDT